MIALDPYVVDFLSQNFITLTIFTWVLNIVAKHTDWVVDDEIYTLLKGILTFGKGKPPMGAPKFEDRGEELK